MTQIINFPQKNTRKMTNTSKNNQLRQHNKTKCWFACGKVRALVRQNLIKKANHYARYYLIFNGLYISLSVLFFSIQLLSQKVGAPKASAAEFYIQKANKMLWEHMRRYSLENVEDGIEKLRNGSLDILITDTPILDYYRATDHGCKLQKYGDTINEDTYAIGMSKGFPLKVSYNKFTYLYFYTCSGICRV